MIKNLAQLIYCDNKNWLKHRADNSVDCIFTDPPYEIPSGTFLGGKGDWLKSGIKSEIDISHISNGIDYEWYFNQFLRVLKKPWMFIFCNHYQLNEWINLIKKNKLKFEIIIISKSQCALNHLPVKRNCEYLLWIYKDWKYIGHNQGASLISQVNKTLRPDIEFCQYFNLKVQKQNKPDYLYHPTLKPVSFIHLIISKFCNKHMLIFDPFAGSGSTLWICNRLGIRSIGLESNRDYYKKSKFLLAFTCEIDNNQTILFN